LNPNSQNDVTFLQWHQWRPNIIDNLRTYRARTESQSS
jgi:hypothetical protein